MVVSGSPEQIAALAVDFAIALDRHGMRPHRTRILDNQRLYLLSQVELLGEPEAARVRYAEGAERAPPRGTGTIAAEAVGQST